MKFTSAHRCDLTSCRLLGSGELPERLVVAILLILPPLACLRHVFRQLSNLWDLPILNIIIKSCKRSKMGLMST